jgi:hypothetical protein
MYRHSDMKIKSQLMLTFIAIVNRIEQNDNKMMFTDRESWDISAGWETFFPVNIQ